MSRAAGRRRWPAWLALGVVILVVGALVAVEVVGRVGAQRLAEQQIARDLPSASVDVVIGESWWQPSVLPALTSGDLDRISVELRDTAIAGVPVAELDYVLNDIDAEVSIAERSVDVRSIGSGSVRMLVDPAAIGSALGVEATIQDGQLVVGPAAAPAALEIVGEDLVVTGEGVERQVIPVADPWWMPCAPDVSIGARHVELTCTGDELPGVLGGTFSAGDAPVGEAPTELEPPATLVPEDDGG